MLSLVWVNFPGKWTLRWRFACKLLLKSTLGNVAWVTGEENRIGQREKLNCWVLVNPIKNSGPPKLSEVVSKEKGFE